jgi:hypothetical protein
MPYKNLFDFSQGVSYFPNTKTLGQITFSVQKYPHAKQKNTTYKKSEVIEKTSTKNHTIYDYANKYFCLFVENASHHTEKAKKAEISPDFYHIT